MTLTDADRVGILAAIGYEKMSEAGEELFGATYLAGKLAGRAEAIEEAARDMLDLAIAMDELWNISHAKRFRKTHFDDDTSFADWAQSRATHTLYVRLHPDYRPSRRALA